jgi:ATP-binding cassette subfamily B protein
VEQAARLTQAHTFITSLKDGYDTQVGEAGNLLSVGQKQLISLTRAVITDPDIFIMDEATSSIDTYTERLIQKGLKAIMKNRTSIIIAHRLSTIQNADRILVLRKGCIIEQGTHEELLAKKGTYFQLHSRGTGEMEEEAVPCHI